MLTNQQQQESLQTLTTVFNYRHNWICREKGSNWSTVKKSLSDNELINLYQDPQTIIGVGFGKETSYLVLDIDTGSLYHYYQDDEAINTIKHILWQELGLEECVMIQSSDSKGIHLYYPFPEPVKSYYLGKTVTEMLEAHGYQVKGGQLEVFPNRKQGRFTTDKKQWTMYNRIRLPLQPETGSCILDDDFNPLAGLDSQGSLKAESLEQFWWLWDRAAACQDMEQLTFALNNKFTTSNNSTGNKPMNNKPTTVNKAITGNKPNIRNRYKTPVMRQIFNELQYEIQQGFTEDAQTNNLLLNLGRRVRIVERIGDSALRDRLLEIVTAMPGYEQYCGHLKDIWQRCQDVARWATKKFYVIGEKKSQPLPELKTSNEQKKRDAEVRILEGLVHAFDRTYQSVREFVGYVTKLVKCSPNVLYKYKELWHERLQGLLVSKNVLSAEAESPKPPENKSQDCPNNLANSAGQMVCNSPASKGLRAFSEAKTEKEEMVCNSKASKGLRAFSPPKERDGLKGRKPSQCVDLSWFLVAPPILRLYILSSGFRLFLQGSFSCLLSNLFLKEDKKNKQSNKSLNQSSSNTPTNHVLHPQQNFTTKKITETTDSETEESLTAPTATEKGTSIVKSEGEFIVESNVVDSVKKQPAPKAVNFEDWYKEAIALGIVEDVPINWLPKMMGQYMVRLPQPDPLTGAPYTLVKWRELALTPKPT